MMIPTLLQFTSAECHAQEDFRFDAGGALGIAGYLGDANPSGLWKNQSAYAEAQFRYIATTRWAFKSAVGLGKFKADTGNMTDILPGLPQQKFSTSFLKAEESAEFNFFNYGMGESYRNLKRWTPYISSGLGLTYWNVSSESGIAFSLPIGVGIKFKPTHRTNVSAAFMMTKTFSDRLDGKILDDPKGIKSSLAKNTDWISTFTLSFSYEFGKRCAVCNYKD